MSISFGSRLVLRFQNFNLFNILSSLWKVIYTAPLVLLGSYMMVQHPADSVTWGLFLEEAPPTPRTPLGAATVGGGGGILTSSLSSSSSSTSAVVAGAFSFLVPVISHRSVLIAWTVLPSAG